MEKKDMIYGTRAVMEAVKAGTQVEKIMIQSGLKNDLLRELIDKARHAGIPIQLVPSERLKRLSSRNHQGVICIRSSVEYASLENLIDRAFGEGREPFFLILDRVTDVRNFGGIVRSAECGGVDGIVVPEKGNALIASDAMKTSAGALHYVPVCREKDLGKTLRFLQERGIRVIACTEKAGKSIYEGMGSGPVAIVLGSEEDGISDVLLRRADDLVSIPMRGKINSLNVSVAAGIAIFEALRQRNGRASRA